MRVRMRLTEVRCRRIWGNFAGISLLIAVRRPERSESPQGVAKFLKEILSCRCSRLVARAKVISYNRIISQIKIYLNTN